MSASTERLSRLLALVPYLLRHQGVPLAEAAAYFGLSEAQLVRDLELLFVCGTPGHLPDDLIEADWQDGRVYLANADAIARPLRLAVDEAVALLVGLRALAEVPGLHDRAAIDAALAKLSAAAGDSVLPAAAVHIDLQRPARSGPPAEHGQERPLGLAAVLERTQQALRTRRRMHLCYLVPARDEATERDVDPMRLLTVENRWYLEGWCHRAEDVRMFRLDRVLAADVLDEDGTPPSGARRRDVGSSLFSPAPDDLLVTLDLLPAARWVADYHPVESVEERPDGRLRIRLRTGDIRWVRRLVIRLADGVRVVDPPALVAEVRCAARQALAGYE